MRTNPQRRIEVCSSCLRAAGLVTNRLEKEAFFQRVRDRVAEQDPEGQLQIEIGQCQRLCPPDRVTLADSDVIPSEFPNGERAYGPANLGVTQAATEDSVVEDILKRKPQS